MKDYEKVLSFWFAKKNGIAFWYGKNKKRDVLVKMRFKNLLIESKKGRLKEWEESSKSTLALIILLDQFSRNIYRDNKKAFEGDGMAQNIVLRGIKKGFDVKVVKRQRGFFYMPLMHSESKRLQKESVKQFKKLYPKMETKKSFAYAHKMLIEIYGRFPHRNKILMRLSTLKEIKYLAIPDAGF